MGIDRDFLAGERRNIEQTLNHVEELLHKKDELGLYEIVALGTFLQNTYSGVERILRCLVEERGIRIKGSETWHKELLQKARAENLLTPEEFDVFLNLLHFRHFHVHGYGHMLDEARLRQLAIPAPKSVRGFLGRLVPDEG